MSTLASLTLLLACTTLGYLAIRLGFIFVAVMLEPPKSTDRNIAS